MAEPTPSASLSPVEAQARLHEVAETLRNSRDLPPEVRAALADLLEELGRDLPASGLPPEELAHLTHSTTQLVTALRRPRKTGLDTERARLEEAAVRLETETPFLAGLLRRVIDALGSIGI